MDNATSEPASVLLTWLRAFSSNCDGSTNQALLGRLGSISGSGFAFSAITHTASTQHVPLQPMFWHIINQTWVTFVSHQIVLIWSFQKHVHGRGCCWDVAPLACKFVMIADDCFQNASEWKMRGSPGSAAGRYRNGSACGASAKLSSTKSPTACLNRAMCRSRDRPVWRKPCRHRMRSFRGGGSCGASDFARHNSQIARFVS